MIAIMLGAKHDSHYLHDFLSLKHCVNNLVICKKGNLINYESIIL